MSKRRDEAILEHGFALLRIFPKAKELGYGPVSLYKRLHRIEAEAHTSSEKWCNGEIDGEEDERKDKSVLRRLDAILGFKEAGIPVFVNGDPRGYSLKIKDEYVRKEKLDIHTDWGGYGILAPEFSGWKRPGPSRGVGAQSTAAVALALFA